MSSAEIQYRAYRPGDESRIIPLYNAVFSKPITPRQWRWEYADNPVGRYDIVVALSGESVVGHSAGVPLVFRHERGDVSATRIQNVLVHPDFQRRGIFTETLRQLTRQLYETSVDFVVTFPNDNSLPGFQRTGEYEHLFDIHPFGLRIDAHRSPANVAVRIELDETCAFRRADVEIVEQSLLRKPREPDARQPRPCTVFNPRSLAYLAWRYHPDSGKRYVVARAFEGSRQVGWAVAKLFEAGRSLDVVELFVPAQPAAVATILAALAGHFRAQSPETFSLWSMPHYPLHAALIDLGFALEQRPTHVVYKALSPRCSADCRTQSSYYLAMGDSDVY